MFIVISVTYQKENETVSLDPSKGEHYVRTLWTMPYTQDSDFQIFSVCSRFIFNNSFTKPMIYHLALLHQWYNM